MKRALVVRLGALGDIVHAIPATAALRRASPEARIDWLVSAKHAAILELVAGIDRRIVINDRIRPRFANRREHRQRMHDVAKRAQTNDQNLHLIRDSKSVVE